MYVFVLGQGESTVQGFPAQRSGHLDFIYTFNVDIYTVQDQVNHILYKKNLPLRQANPVLYK